MARTPSNSTLTKSSPNGKVHQVPVGPQQPGLFSYYNNRIASSTTPPTPCKSTSINELYSHTKRTPFRKNQTLGGGGPEGGMVIYYSPDAGGYFPPSNDGGGRGSGKFSSESQLNSLHHRGSPASSASPASGDHPNSTSPLQSSPGSFSYKASKPLQQTQPIPFGSAIDSITSIQQSSYSSSIGTSTVTSTVGHSSSIGSVSPSNSNRSGGGNANTTLPNTNAGRMAEKLNYEISV